MGGLPAGTNRPLVALVPFSLLFLFRAVVASIALAWLASVLHVTCIGRLTFIEAMITISSFQFVDSLLQLTKVQFQVFVDLSHFKILLLEVLTTLVRRC